MTDPRLRMVPDHLIRRFAQGNDMPDRFIYGNNNGIDGADVGAIDDDVLLLAARLLALCTLVVGIGVGVLIGRYLL